MIVPGCLKQAFYKRRKKVIPLPRGASFRTSKIMLMLTWRLYYCGAVIISITVDPTKKEIGFSHTWLYRIRAATPRGITTVMCDSVQWRSILHSSWLHGLQLPHSQLITLYIICYLNILTNTQDSYERSCSSVKVGHNSNFYTERGSKHINKQ